jgi:hypothetical protein
MAEKILSQLVALRPGVVFVVIVVVVLLFVSLFFVCCFAQATLWSHL